MSLKTIGLTDDLHRYVRDVGTRDDPLLKRLRDETAAMAKDGVDARMQVAPEQGAFLGWLAGALGVRRAVEVGTFTGYSALCVARALPADGELICIDSEPRFTDVARRFFDEAGVAGKVDVRTNDGLDELDRMIAAGGSGNHDWCFHDADKTRLTDYVERFLRLLRPGGVLLVDNALRNGAVVDPEPNSATAAMDAMNRALRDDGRLDWCLLPVGDGLAMGRVR